MRPDTCEPEESLWRLLLTAIVISPILIINGCYDARYKKSVKEKTDKLVLNKAHEQAVAAVDTINFDDIVVNVRHARKDSVRTTKKMYDIMDEIHRNRIINKRFFDYIQDTIPITSHYDKTIHTIVDSINHDTVRVKISHSKQSYGVSQKFSINKAMNDSVFATTYNQYCESIKKLEIARRQGKLK